MRPFTAFLIIFVGATVILTACATPTPSPSHLVPTPIPTVIEPGLAFGEPCKPPCWRGLIPGRSSRQDVAKAIEQLKASGWAKSIDGDSEGFTAYPLVGMDGNVGVMVISGTVALIDGDILFNYTLGNMVEQFGNPEGVYTPVPRSPLRTSCQERQLGGPSILGDNALYLLYPSQGIAFLALVPYLDGDLLCSEMRAVRFVYHPPFSLQAGLKKDYLVGLFANEGLKGITEDDLIKWHGFGTGY